MGIDGRLGRAHVHHDDALETVALAETLQVASGAVDGCAGPLARLEPADSLPLLRLRAPDVRRSAAGNSPAG